MTTGSLQVAEVAGGTAEQRLAVAAVESYSEHPIARAVTAALRGDATLPAVTDFQARPGIGAEGWVDGSRIEVGKVHGDRTLSVELNAAVTNATERGNTPVVASFDGEAVMVIELGDSIKSSSPAAISRLMEQGLTPILLTGDRSSTATAVAEQVGIQQVIADVAPADKAAEIQRLQQDGSSVAMVGDGINDAAALAQANLGVAMGTGTDAAREAADITVVNSDLESVADAIELARRTWRTIKQNLGWAFAYNLAAIPLAMTGRLSPMIASAAMALSSVLVVTNSLRLRHFGSRRSGAATP